MTTYRELPEEVLRIIFANLDNKDILNCQYTCRSWYLPAHISLLGEIQLNEPQQVASFIASIDQNPDPSYLKAVKKLKIIDAGNDEEEVNRIYGLPFQIDGNKLISRFVNLKKVEIQDSLVIFDNFTEETCDRIRTNCQQLDTFSVRSYDLENFPKNFSEILYMLRSLITNIDVGDLYDIPEIEEFISSFPRLKSIEGHHEDILRFQGWLPIYVKSPNLKEIGVDCSWDDDRAFMERFLRSKSGQQGEMIVKRLSEISKLTWSCSQNFNSLKFIKKYLTGLTKIEISCNCREPFYSMALNVASSIAEYKLSTYTEGTFLPTCLPTMMKKVFYPLSPTCKTVPRRVLQYQILSSGSVTRDVSVFLTAKSSLQQSLQSIEVKSIGGFDLIDLFLDVPFVRNDVVEFWLKLSYHFYHYIDTEWYDKVFARIAVFNKITIDIPSSYRDSQPRYELHAKYNRIQDLTLRASPDLKIQTLINRCYFAFPSLQRLNIFNHSGTWNESTNNFQLDLEWYSLKQLTLDLTPVKTKYLQKKELTDDAFIVVEISSSDEQYLCKIPLCRTKSATIVDESVWDSSADHLAVYVTVNNVKQVKFCIYHDKCDSDIYTDEDLQKSFGNATCSTVELC